MATEDRCGAGSSGGGVSATDHQGAFALGLFSENATQVLSLNICMTLDFNQVSLLRAEWEQTIQ